LLVQFLPPAILLILVCFFDHKILEDIVKDPDIDTWSEY